MTAQPAPKTQELSDKIFSFLSKKRRPSPFNIQSLKRDVEQLNGKIDYANYYDFLGRISAWQ